MALRRCYNTRLVVYLFRVEDADTALERPPSGPAHRALAAARRVEDAIRLDADETVIAFDRAGREVFRKRGHGDSVDIEPSELRRLRGCVLTHNHPGAAIDGPPALRGLSFSEADVQTAATAQVAELRAITVGWRYAMRPPPSGWNRDWWQHVLEPARQVAYREAAGDLRPRLLRGELTRDEMAALLLHETWSRVASRLGMRYSRRQVKP